MPYNLKSLLPTCIMLTWVYIVVEVLFVAALFWETGVYRGIFSQGPEVDIEFYLLDVALALAGFGLLIAAVAAYIVNGIWIYRASANASAIAPSAERTSPGWAVGWYFIPFANLWMPFRAMKQTYNSSMEAGRPLNAPVGLPFGIWWLMWVTSSVIGNISMRWSIRAENDSEWITIGYLDMASSTLGIVAAYFFMHILREITRAQDNQTGVADVFS